LVDQRKALEDITEDYEEGGKDLVEALKFNHDTEKDQILANFEAAKIDLSKGYSHAQHTIARGLKEDSTSSISGLEVEWRDEHDALQSFISESMED